MLQEEWKQKKVKHVPIQSRLTKADFERLERMRNENEMSVASLVRVIIRKALTRFDGEPEKPVSPFVWESNSTKRSERGN